MSELTANNLLSDNFLGNDADPESDICIYVACLASYNNGILYGKWINVEHTNEGEIMEQISDMLKNSPTPNAEEWEIHDYSLYDGLQLDDRHKSLAGVLSVVDYITDNQRDYPIEMLIALYNQEGFNGIPDSILDDYIGEYESVKEFVNEKLSEGFYGEISEHLSRYIDIDSLAKDEEISLMVLEGFNSVYIFNQ